MRPPIPVPITTAHRAGSAPGSPASPSASAAAAKPSCVTRSTRRASFAPRYSVGSKSRTSHPMRTDSGDASKRWIGAAAERPLRSCEARASRVVPAGVLTPTPVTATRARPRASVASFAGTLLRPHLREHEVDGLADGRDTFEVVLGHLDVEALFEAHHQLNEVEAVGVEILLEARTLGDEPGLDAQDLGGDILDRCQRSS